MPYDDRKITFENRKILFRNFSGEEGKFNAPGRRNFCIVLSLEEAELMKKDGWNVRFLLGREEGDAELPILKVNVNYGSRRPPRIVLITSRGKTNLGESDLTLLDWAEITNVDLIINPYVGPGRETPTAYLDSLYVTIQEDELELKYLDVPDSALAGLTEEREEEEPDE